MGKKIWVSMHPRNFGSQVTVHPCARPSVSTTGAKCHIFFLVWDPSLRGKKLIIIINVHQTTYRATTGTEAGDAITKAKFTKYYRIGPQEKLSGNSVNPYAICLHFRDRCGVASLLLRKSSQNLPSYV